MPVPSNASNVILVPRVMSALPNVKNVMQEKLVLERTVHVNPVTWASTAAVQTHKLYCVMIVQKVSYKVKRVKQVVCRVFQVHFKV